MLDDAPIDVGKIQNSYLTDEQGRRIFFPIFGPARLVPSREEEAKFRERRFFAALAVPAGYAMGSGVKIFWLSDFLAPLIAESLFLLWLAGLGTMSFIYSELLAQRWESVPESVRSPDDYIVGVFARRSLPTLWRMAVLRTLGFLCVAALPVVSMLHPDFHWRTATGLEWSVRIPTALLFLAMLPFAGRGVWRAGRALGERSREKSRS